MIIFCNYYNSDVLSEADCVGCGIGDSIRCTCKSCKKENLEYYYCEHDQNAIDFLESEK